MKHFKKILSIVLVVMMIMTLIPVNSFAEAPATEAASEAVVEETTEAAEEVEESTEEATTEKATEAVNEEKTTEAKTSVKAKAATQALGAETQAVTMDTIKKNKSVSLDTSKFYRIFHLDAGRKYFSVNQIEAIIDLLAANNYTHLELALGNDALRLILDDMSVEANGTSYSSNSVKSGIASGNSTYARSKSTDTTTLTEAEMDSIISYANSKNIGIIPLINAPGHMDAILACIKSLDISSPAYNNSATTVNVENAEAVNFTLALVNKYINYFASKGIKIFNMGADEYANDVYTSSSTGHGFGHIVNTATYTAFLTFVNNMAAQIQNAGMVPMAFNDGLYYNGKKPITLDTNIAVAYWSCGYDKYYVDPASDLVAAGLKIINTNDGWYYVLGRSQSSDTYGLPSAKKNVANTKVTDVPLRSGYGTKVSDPVGSMLCLWCDTPSVSYSTTEYNNVKYLVETQANSNPTYFVATTPVIPEEPVYEMSDSNNTVTINTEASQTALTSVSVKSSTVEGISAAYTAYNVIINDGTYTGKAMVTIPLTDALKAADKLVGFVVNADKTITKVSGSKTADGNSYTFEAPHFSVVGVMADVTPAANVKNTVNVELEVGQTSTTYKEESGAYNSGTGLNTSIATAVITPVSTTGKVTTNNITSTNNISSSQKYLLVNNAASKTLTDTASSSGLALNGTVAGTDGKGGEIWNIIPTSGGYYVVNENGKYLTIGNGTAAVVDEPHVLAFAYNSSRRWQISETVTTPTTTTSYTENKVSLSNSNYTNYRNNGYYYKDGNDYYLITNITRSTSGRNVVTYTYTITYNGKTATVSSYRNDSASATFYQKKEVTTPSTNTYYLNNNNGSGVYAAGYTTGNYDTNSRWNIYTVTATEDVHSTNVQFTGVTAGTTSMVVGETQYNITVKRKAVNESVLVGASNSYTDTTASTATIISGGEFVTVNTSGNTISITGKAVGTAVIQTNNCTYTINVVAEDLSGISPVTVYYWITNNTVTANNATSQRINASDANVHSAQGAKIADLLPEYGKHGSDNVHYWKTVCHSSSEKQTSLGTNQTSSGTTFNYIRYFNGAWAYSVDGSDWVSIGSGYVLDAYYLQVTPVTNEVTTEVVDWGEIYSGYGDSNYVMLDYSVKYESGDETPSSFPVAGKTLGFHCNYNSSSDLNKTVFAYNSTYYRRIGMIRAAETEDYEVYMITLTPTTDAGGDRSTSGCKYNTSYTYQGKEVVAWAATAEDYENSGLEKYTSYSNNFKYSEGGQPIVGGLEILNRTGMKVTYYVRAKVTEDSLTVKYVDDTTGTEFYNYGIIVNKGTTFKTNIGLNNIKAVVNGDVTNSLGKTQTVSSDLATMPAIPAAYRYSEYTVQSLERSADGKTVTIHYTFNNTHSFVIDFGLPLKISTSDLGISGDWTSATISGAKYGEAKVAKGEGVTYTPNQTLKGVEQLNLVLTGSQGSATHIIYIYPATTVYYEEGFAEMTGFTPGSKGTDSQTTSAAKSSKASEAAVYGYDKKYADETTDPSNGTQATSNTVGDTAEFTFTGTGVDVYANTTTKTGRMMVTIYDADGKIKKAANINTAMLNGDGNDTNYQEVNGYNEPVYTLKGLDRGSYRVKISHIKLASESTPGVINIDGFRVHGTIDTSDKVYENDLEDNPDYIELRNQVLAVYGVKKDDKTCEQVYTTDTAEEATVAITVNESTSVADVQDLLENGPKNELYLKKGMKLTFNVNTKRKVQIGLKALNEETKYTINGEDKSITTSTDMFYPVNAGKVVIENNGTGILAITTLKICDDPEAALLPLTEEDIISGLVLPSEPETPVDPSEPELPSEPETPTEPETPEVKTADATLNITLVDYKGKAQATTSLTATGTEGETATFTAEEIKAAATKALPAKYGIDESSIKAVQVVYGETGTAKIVIGKVASLTINYKKGSKVVGTATLTAVQTSSASKYTFSTSEIKAACPAGYSVISLLGTSVNYGSSKTITGTCR